MAHADCLRPTPFGVLSTSCCIEADAACVNGSKLQRKHDRPGESVYFCPRCRDMDYQGDSGRNAETQGCRSSMRGLTAVQPRRERQVGGLPPPKLRRFARPSTRPMGLDAYVTHAERPVSSTTKFCFGPDTAIPGPSSSRRIRHSTRHHLHRPAPQRHERNLPASATKRCATIAACVQRPCCRIAIAVLACAPPQRSTIALRPTPTA